MNQRNRRETFLLSLRRIDYRAGFAGRYEISFRLARIPKQVE